MLTWASTDTAIRAPAFGANDGQALQPRETATEQKEKK